MSKIKERLPFWDNARFILIFLVVLGHGSAIEKLGNPYLSSLWLTFGLVRMPGMMFISGFFSKNAVKDGKVDPQKPFTYALMYGVAQVAVWLFEYIVLGDQGIEKSFILARSSLWFLQVLVIYQLILPFLLRLKMKAVIIIALAGGLLIGFDVSAGHLLSIARAFVFLPFFVAGLYFPKDGLKKVKSLGLWSKFAAAAYILVIFFLKAFDCMGYTWGLHLEGKSIVGVYNYWAIGNSMGQPWYLMWLYRVEFYVLAALMILAFLILIPERKTFFTVFGTRTMSVYILHRFVYLMALQYGWLQALKDWTPYSFWILLAIVFALTVVLSLKPFDYLFAWQRKIKIKRFLKEE